MLEFELEGPGYYVAERYHEPIKTSITYVIEKYEREYFSAWMGRALRSHDIIAQCEMFENFEDVAAWAERVASQIDSGELWKL